MRMNLDVRVLAFIGTLSVMPLATYGLSPKVFSYKVTIPAGTKVKLLLPDTREPKILGEREHLYTIKVEQNQEVKP